MASFLLLRNIRWQIINMKLKIGSVLELENGDTVMIIGKIIEKVYGEVYFSGSTNGLFGLAKIGWTEDGTPIEQTPKIIRLV